MSDLTKAREQCGLKSQEKALCGDAALDRQKSGRKKS